jgi:hypothetical protein
MRHLADVGIRERELERLMVVIGPLFARARRDGLDSARAEGLCRIAVRKGGVPAHAGLRRMRPDARRRFGYRQKLG